ncbi:hypothetical protein KP79_PYT03512 [Mizuhopecten yessoensis]|uniref:LRAT domain-containing protein n=2 Tax=Mizuhopecten yessoensis TaxID=6573 RepID=A0A210PDB5_MIZYE|nr:hypothetical protein KP79_PYT03512 [Mizuhopecten yessoensis]
MCHCERKGNPHKVNCYWDSSGKFIGFYCTRCGVESLTQEYIADINDTNLRRVYRRKPPILEDNTAFQVPCSKTKVDLHHFADILKPGDHVTWLRYFLYWHHGIVSEINAEENTIGMIHWVNMNGENTFKIIYERIKVKNDPMYRIHYTDSVTKENPTEIVLARARSRIGDIRYKLFSDNCESFATFCKCGVAKSRQIVWLKRKIKQIIGHYMVVGTESFGIVVGMETAFMVSILRKACKERRNGKITKNDFTEILIRRIYEGLLSSELIMIGYYIGTPFGPLGIFIGVIIGGVVGGVVGKAAWDCIREY